MYRRHQPKGGKSREDAISLKMMLTPRIFAAQDHSLGLVKDRENAGLRRSIETIGYDVVNIAAIEDADVVMVDVL
jgi:hypothetical protein